MAKGNSNVANEPEVSPFLWFDNNAQEAAEFYEAVFAGNRERKSGEKVPTKAKKPKGMSAEFVLNGRRFVGFNGGPHFKFNEAISLSIDCESQEEIDYFWTALMEGGGKPSQCGWLKDRFGLSWQVVPHSLQSLLGRGKAMQTMMGMSKLVIAELEAAAEQ